MSDPIPEITVNDLPDFLGAISAAVHDLGPNLWWRGHANMAWSLCPSVFRDPRNGTAWEQNITLLFRRAAPTRYARCPDAEDFPAWLQLMQHYRLPTRLLDWSLSPLISLYFASDRDPDSPAGSDADGAVWLLQPYLLNQAQAEKLNVFNPTEPLVTEVIAPAFNKDAAPSTRIVATLGDEIDLRMSLQLASFTLHGSAAPLETASGADQYLRRITIPAAVKPGMRMTLWTLGIRRSTLFPDLENLAAELAALDFDP